ncbi:integration host factor subunit alpha [Microvirga yunnanensis]|uniref:integration host factor subunit alpha n=1 Tax=Microvirga yunnanensis TaxID=2953740 RepID=UPI0021CA61C0|nr:integration host factor subunit alpha [Microvirga sp. HBU65207]
MLGRTITRADLTKAVSGIVSLSRAETTELVEQVLGEISATLVAGEGVKLSAFGVFTVRHKTERVGRNPRTQEAVPIEPCRSLTFSASPHLKSRINGSMPKPRLRRRDVPLVSAQVATE